MYCTQCGKVLLSNASYCSYCGAAAAGTAAASEGGSASDLRPPTGDSRPPFAGSSETTRPRFKIPKWMRYIAILLLLLLFSKVLEHFSESFKQVLHAADNFFKHGVENVAPFHLCAVFCRNILDDLSSSSQQGSASLGRQLPSLSARRFKPSERYSRRVRPASSQLRLSCSAEFP